jgi:hypothetical protein
MQQGCSTCWKVYNSHSFFILGMQREMQHLLELVYYNLLTNYHYSPVTFTEFSQLNMV